MNYNNYHSHLEEEDWIAIILYFAIMNCGSILRFFNRVLDACYDFCSDIFWQLIDFCHRILQ